jgi:hypothetical protein
LFICDKDKQWPLEQHLPNLLITLANLARPMSFFSKKRFGKCEHFGEYHVMAFGKFLQNWRVWQVWRVPTFLCFCMAILHLPDLLNLPNPPNWAIFKFQLFK